MPREKKTALKKIRSASAKHSAARKSGSKLSSSSSSPNHLHRRARTEGASIVVGIAGERTSIPEGYKSFLRGLKKRIQAAQVRAALAVSRQLLRLYWEIGRDIVARQDSESWGSSIIERLAKDLRAAFPGMEGFSARNLWRMRAFYLAYRQGSKDLPRAVADGVQEDLPRVVADLPWGHHIILLEKVKDSVKRGWYAAQALKHGWSRAVLILQIETGLVDRAGQAVTNFRKTLPSPQSDLAQQALKDPYTFDFLTLSRGAHERDLERALLRHIRDFLLELGVGFAFVGSQVHIGVGDQDFYIDLLFFHLKLRCYVVIELKAVPFEPSFAGVLNFYLSAVDDQMRHPDDRPSIGLLLCKSKDRLVMEYALRDLQKPIGVAEWETRMVESLPEELQGSLPTVEELEAELSTPERKRGKR